MTYIVESFAPRDISYRTFKDNRYGAVSLIAEMRTENLLILIVCVDIPCQRIHETILASLSTYKLV